MVRDHLDHLLLDGQKWIERSHRVLKNHCDLTTPDVVQFLPGHLHQVLSFEFGLTGSRTVFRQQTHNRHDCLAFSCTRLSDNGETFAVLDTEIQVINCLHFPLRCVKFDLQACHFEQGHQSRSLGSSASRIPSPM